MSRVGLCFFVVSLSTSPLRLLPPNGLRFRAFLELRKRQPHYKEREAQVQRQTEAIFRSKMFLDLLVLRRTRHRPYMVWQSFFLTRVIKPLAPDQIVEGVIDLDPHYQRGA